MIDRVEQSFIIPTVSYIGKNLRFVKNELVKLLIVTDIINVRMLK